MGLKLYIDLIVIVAVIGLLNPPMLDTESVELLLRSEDNITVRCYGDLPLNWTYPVNKVTTCICLVQALLLLLSVSSHSVQR